MNRTGGRGVVGCVRPGCAKAIVASAGPCMALSLVVSGVARLVALVTPIAVLAGVGVALAGPSREARIRAITEMTNEEMFAGGLFSPDTLFVQMRPSGIVVDGGAGGSTAGAGATVEFRQFSEVPVIAVFHPGGVEVERREARQVVEQVGVQVREYFPNIMVAQDDPRVPKRGILMLVQVHELMNIKDARLLLKQLP